MCFAQEERIIEGYPTGFFMPDQNVNFAEAAKIIVNSFGYETETGDIWYQPYADVLAEKDATPSSILTSDQLITRGEMAEMIYVLHSKLTITQDDCTLYTYQDEFESNIGRHCINKVTVVPIYFVAADQTDEIPSDWKGKLTLIFDKSTAFYEEQFEGRISFTVEEPELRYGDKNIADYSSLYDQVFKEEMAEEVTADHFIIYSVYYHNSVGAYGGSQLLNGDYDTDGVHNNGSISINPSFWLEDDSLYSSSKYGTTCIGYINSGHELGHSLGLSHPWEMEINRDSEGNILDPTYKYSEEGNIMAYAGGGLLSDDPADPFGGYFVMDEAKEVMMSN